MEREPNTYAHSITHEFLKAALADGAQKIQPSWKTRWTTVMHLNPAVWAKQQNITGIYFGTSLSLDEIGQRYGGISRQAIRQIIEKGIRNLHKNSSAETQVKFPLADIPFGKPMSATANIENKAFTSASKLNIISQELETGIKDPDQIAANTNLSIQEIRRALKIIHSQSEKTRLLRIHQKYENKRVTWQAICSIVKYSEDKTQTQAAIDILDHYHATKLIRQKDPSLLCFTSILGKYPARFAKKINVILRGANIPVLRINYDSRTQKECNAISYYLPKRFAETALNVLKNSPLKEDIKNKVRQISGPPASFTPTTFEMQHSKKFKKVGSILPYIYSSNPEKISLQELSEGCPAPIFIYSVKSGDHYFFSYR